MAGLGDIGAKAGKALGKAGAGGPIGTIIGGAMLLDSITGLLASPKLLQTADVIIYGNSKSNKAELFKQAVATAFGLIRRMDNDRFNPPAGEIEMEYNAELKYIRFRVTQYTTWTSIAISAKRTKAIQLFDGPPSNDIFKGGDWQWNASNPLLKRFPGAPFGLDFFTELFGSGTLIVTGWENRTIITPFSTFDGNIFPCTGQVSRSPRPMGDLISRGPTTLANDPCYRSIVPGDWYTNPEFLIFNALADPCSAASQLPAPYPVEVKKKVPTVPPKTDIPADVPTLPRIPYPPGVLSGFASGTDDYPNLTEGPQPNTPTPYPPPPDSVNSDGVVETAPTTNPEEEFDSDE